MCVCDIWPLGVHVWPMLAPGSAEHASGAAGECGAGAVAHATRSRSPAAKSRLTLRLWHATRGVMTECFANLGTKLGRTLPMFGQLELNLTRVWPALANVGRIWAETRLPEQLSDNRRAPFRQPLAASGQWWSSPGSPGGKSSGRVASN